MPRVVISQEILSQEVLKAYTGGSVREHVSNLKAKLGPEGYELIHVARAKDTYWLLLQKGLQMRQITTRSNSWRQPKIT